MFVFMSLKFVVFHVYANADGEKRGEIKDKAEKSNIIHLLRHKRKNLSFSDVFIWLRFVGGKTNKS